jgi:hypothetical protein
MKLYSYCLRHDDGAAPNPFWGLCTLAICKPAIRRTAKIGDWIAGLGSANSPIGDISEFVVYAMKISEKMTLQEYDAFCKDQCLNKIPIWRSRDYRQRVGDCIYDYSAGSLPKLRWGVHTETNRSKDLRGIYVLISNHFYYFGDNPIKLCDSLRPIIHPTQGHKSAMNQPYLEEFVSWLEGLGYIPNQLYGEPQLKSLFTLSKTTST